MLSMRAANIFGRSLMSSLTYMKLSEGTDSIWRHQGVTYHSHGAHASSKPRTIKRHRKIRLATQSTSERHVIPNNPENRTEALERSIPSEGSRREAAPDPTQPALDLGSGGHSGAGSTGGGGGGDGGADGNGRDGGADPSWPIFLRILSLALRPPLLALLASIIIFKLLQARKQSKQIADVEAASIEQLFPDGPRAASMFVDDWPPGQLNADAAHDSGSGQTHDTPGPLSRLAAVLPWRRNYRLRQAPAPPRTLLTWVNGSHCITGHQWPLLKIADMLQNPSHQVKQLLRMALQPACEVRSLTWELLALQDCM